MKGEGRRVRGEGVKGVRGEGVWAVVTPDEPPTRNAMVQATTTTEERAAYRSSW